MATIKLFVLKKNLILMGHWSLLVIFVRANYLLQMKRLSLKK